MTGTVVLYLPLAGHPVVLSCSGMPPTGGRDTTESIKMAGIPAREPPSLTEPLKPVQIEMLTQVLESQ